MKKILWICSVLLAMVSCQEDYELNTDFAVPTELSSPASIQLNVSSPTPVVLSWSGGGAADGGIVLYEVLFDKADGDFSKPLATVKSDLGAATSLSITHAAINTIARNAGIYPLETGYKMDGKCFERWSGEENRQGGYHHSNSWRGN